jgi:DNA primase
VSAIEALLIEYFPDWVPPADRGGWTACKCPFHGERNASASVNYKENAFNCHGCGYKGDAIKIIQDKEGVSFRDAKRKFEELGGGEVVSSKLSRQQGRILFGQARTRARADPTLASRLR